MNKIMNSYIEKRNTFFKALVFALCFAFLIVLMSCTTAKSFMHSDSDQNEVQQFELDNGIPVYVKENHSNRLVSMYLIVKGGVALLPPEDSGLEAGLVRMMKSGSEKYSYEELQDILYRTHASFFGFSQNEGSGLGMECLDYYLDDLLPVVADGFLHPAFGQNEYDTMKKEFSQRLQSILNNPSALASYTAMRTIYKNHPYETQESVTVESIDNITVENMKNLHEKILDARRISIVIVGNVKAAKVAKKLNVLLGSIPVREDDFVIPEIPPVTLGDKNVVLSNPASEGTGFMVECFSSPSVTDSDYAAANIAANMYSDVLHQVVREEHGACYTPYADVFSSKAPYGIVFLYRVSDLEHAASYVLEAQKIMEGGKLIAGRNPDNSFVFEDIESRLESYKNMYVSGKYSQMQTNRGVAGKLGASLLQFDDVTSADALLEKVSNVTSEDVSRVFEKYFVKSKKQWFCVTGPGNEGKIRF